MAGTHAPHFLVEKNAAGDIEVQYNGDLSEERTARYARQSSTGRTAEGPAYRDGYRPLHLIDELGPGVLVPDDRHRLQSIVFNYGSVQKKSFRNWLDRLRSRPGMRMGLILWGRPQTYAWTGDGISRELYTYQVMAKDAFEAAYGAPIEGGHPELTGGNVALEYDPELWVEGNPVPLSRVDAPTFEGIPTAGTAWWLDQGQRIKLGDVPPIRAVIHCKLLPLWRAVEDVGQDGPRSTRGQAPGLEPRRLALTEAQE